LHPIPIKTRVARERVRVGGVGVFIWCIGDIGDRFGCTAEIMDGAGGNVLGYRELAATYINLQGEQACIR
jgi:hypothetical protein